MKSSANGRNAPPVDSHRQDEQVGVVDDGRERRHEALPEERHVEREVRVGAHRRGQAPERLRRLAERLHDGHAAHVLHRGVRHALLVDQMAPHLVRDRLVGEARRLDAERRDHARHRRQAEAPVEDEEQHHDRHRRRERRRHVGQRVGEEPLDGADALVHDLPDAPRAKRLEPPQRDAPQVLDDLELEVVLGVEGRRVRAEKRREVEADVARHAPEGHPAEARHAGRVERGEVRIDRDDVPHHKVDRDERDERARRRERRERHREVDEPPPASGEADDAGGPGLLPARALLSLGHEAPFPLRPFG